MEQWKIHKDRVHCEKPGCPLARSAEYYVVLELPDCVRRDLCEPCFREREASHPVYWKAHRQEAKPREAVLDLASLRQLFDRLGEPDIEGEGEGDGDGVTPGEAGAEPAAKTPAQPQVETEDAVDRPRAPATDLRYLVALLLLRKRVLRMVDAATPEQEAADLVVIDPKIPDMEPVCLQAPAELDSDRLGSLKEDLLAAIGD